MLLGTLKRRGGRAALWLVVGLMVGGAVGAAGTYLLKRGKAGIPGGPRLGKADELDLVPGDAAGFVHIRLRGLWNADELSEMRKIVEAAGPRAMATLDESFVPAPSTLDRATVVFVKVPPAAPAKGGLAPPPRPGFAPNIDGLPADLIPPIGDDVTGILLLAFSAPFDPAKVRESHAKGAVAKNIGGREYWEDDETDVGLHFANNNTTMAIGTASGMRGYMARVGTTTGSLAKAVEHARDGGFHFVAALNVARLGIPLKKLDEAPAEYKDATRAAQAVLKAECLMVGTAYAENGTKIEIRASYKDDAGATAAEAALRDLAKFGKTKLAEPKKEMEAALNGPPDAKRPRPLSDLPKVVGGLFGLGTINALDEWLTDPPLKTDGTEVVFAPKLPSVTAMYASAAAVSVGMLIPAVDKVRVSAGRMKDSNNLKQIGLAMHNYHDTIGSFPAQDGAMFGKKGGLSWRVHILPHIEQDALYKQFRLDEPWDSAHNKKLIDQMPVTYASPLATDPAGQTRYKAFSGTDAVLFPGSRTRFADITDGTSNTILAVGGGTPVIWTKPDDIPAAFAPSVLALPGQTGCNVVMCDGSVRWVELARLTPEKLKAAVTRAGGEVIGLDDLDAPRPPFGKFPAPIPGPEPKTKTK